MKQCSIGVYNNLECNDSICISTRMPNVMNIIESYIGHTCKHTYRILMVDYIEYRIWWNI